MKTTEDYIHEFERQQRERDERFREYMRSIGRDDLLAEYDRNMKDIRTGVTSARATWEALSTRQRSVLKTLSNGYKLRRRPGKTTLYDAHGTIRCILAICRIKTIRALCLRDVAHVDGGATDPEAEIVVTERGRFVARQGGANGNAS